MLFFYSEDFREEDEDMYIDGDQEEEYVDYEEEEDEDEGLYYNREQLMERYNVSTEGNRNVENMLQGITIFVVKN